MAIIIIVLALTAVVLVILAFALGRRGSADPGLSGAYHALPEGSPGENNWLLGIGGEVEGRPYLLGMRQATIGRAPGNRVQVDNEKASRAHCRLTPGEGRIQVEDLNSQNGTKINGQPVTVGVLQPGDELTIGAAVFKYLLRGEFAKNEAIQAKRADAKRFASTVQSQGQGVGDMIGDALRRHGGDYVKAAAELHVDPDTLRHIATVKGLHVE